MGGTCLNACEAQEAGICINHSHALPPSPLAEVVQPRAPELEAGLRQEGCQAALKQRLHGRVLHPGSGGGSWGRGWARPLPAPIRFLQSHEHTPLCLNPRHWHKHAPPPCTLPSPKIAHTSSWPSCRMATRLSSSNADWGGGGRGVEGARAHGMGPYRWVGWAPQRAASPDCTCAGWLSAQQQRQPPPARGCSPPSTQPWRPARHGARVCGGGQQAGHHAHTSFSRGCRAPANCSRHWSVSGKRHSR